jgi:hypothetical protein
MPETEPAKREDGDRAEKQGAQVRAAKTKPQNERSSREAREQSETEPRSKRQETASNDFIDIEPSNRAWSKSDSELSSLPKLPIEREDPNVDIPKIEKSLPVFKSCVTDNSEPATTGDVTDRRP